MSLFMYFMTLLTRGKIQLYLYNIRFNDLEEILNELAETLYVRQIWI